MTSETENYPAQRDRGDPCLKEVKVTKATPKKGVGEGLGGIQAGGVAIAAGGLYGFQSFEGLLRFGAIPCDF